MRLPYRATFLTVTAAAIAIAWVALPVAASSGTATPETARPAAATGYPMLKVKKVGTLNTATALR